MPVLRSFPTIETIPALPGIRHCDSTASYPRHPITFVVGFPPGGPIHSLAGLIAKFMSKEFGQRVIIQNRPGAAGNLAAESVAHAPPNGYTLYVCYRGNTINRLLYRSLDVDLMRDFVPVGLLATAPNILVVNKNVAVANLADLISFAMRFPGKLTCGSAGPGASSHLLCELFKAATRTDILNILYQGAGPALNDLLAGRIDAKFESFPSSYLHVRAGSLLPIAIASQKRMPCLPDTPTMEESGIPGFCLDNWYGLMAPAGTASDIAIQLNESLNRALLNSRLQRKFSELGYFIPQRPNGPGVLLDLIARECKKWQAILRLQHQRSSTLASSDNIESATPIQKQAPSERSRVCGLGIRRQGS